jgi:hypothetical protein
MQSIFEFDYVHQRTIANSIIFYSSHQLPIYCRPIDNDIDQLIDSLTNADKLKLRQLVLAKTANNYINISMHNVQTKQTFIVSIINIIRYFIDQPVVPINNDTIANQSIRLKCKQILVKYQHELTIFTMSIVLLILFIILIVILFHLKMK